MPQLLPSLVLLSPFLIQQAPPPAPEPNGDSGGPSISDDGRWIVFESRASNFVPGEVKDTWDVFLYDRESGDVNRINEDHDSAARSPQISGDGRWIAFLQARPTRGVTSEHSFFASTEHPWAVGLHDRREGTTQWLGETEPTYGLDDGPRAPSITRDGSRLVFSANHGDVPEVRLYESNGAEHRAAELTIGTSKGDRGVRDPSLSRSGRYLVFATARRGLAAPQGIPEDLQHWFDFGEEDTHVYRRDLEIGKDALVSDLAFAAIGYAQYDHPHVSDDGRVVAYDHHDPRLMGATHVAFASDLEKREAGRLIPVDGGDRWWDGAVTVSWLSSDGRHAIVDSYSNLIPVVPPECDAGQVLLRELGESKWDLLSRSPDGSPGNRTSWGGVASADLSVIAFSSEATNLVARDSNRSSDVFVLERASGRMTRIVARSPVAKEPAPPTPGQPNGDSGGAQVSDDGQFIVFASQASNFDDRDFGDSWDIFLHTPADGSITRLSLEEHAMVSMPVISGDGRWIAYWSRPDVEGHNPAPWALRMLERPSGTWSSVEGLEPFLYDCGYLESGPSISHDGSRLAFQAPGPVRSNQTRPHVAKVYDRKLGIPSIVSLDDAGRINEASAQSVVISGDGSTVAFWSQSTSLAPWPISEERRAIPGQNDCSIFVRDLEKGTTRAANDPLALLGASGSVFDPRLSSDGSRIAFNLRWNQTAGFVVELDKNLPHRLLPAVKPGENARGGACIVWLSADGNTVLASGPGEFIPGSAPTPFPQLFLHDRTGAVWTPISRTPAGEYANRPVESAVATRDLSKVVFESEADNLVAGDTNNAQDVFIADVATGRITRIERAAQ